ncbi:MAG: class I SAM-dependent methyltransferase [Ignavibacteriaceae bacterium]
MFEPKILGLFVNPFYISRKGLLKYIKPLGKYIGGKTLDVGCGIKPYKKYFNSKEYIGIDLKTTLHNSENSIDVYYDGKVIPFNNEQFDSVVTSQVLEHVFHPDLFLSETNRVLKTNGYLLITVPFVWDEHEKPFDFGRYSSFGIVYLLEKNGFEIKEHFKTANNFAALAQLINLYVYKLVHNKNSLFKKLVTLFLMAPITSIGVILGKILPDNDDLFLDNVILAIKKKH